MSTDTPLSQQTVRIPDVYLSKFSDEHLAELAKLTDNRISPQAPALGTCLAANIIFERERRRRAEAGEVFEPRAMTAQLELWSDADVGAAIEVMTAFSLGTHEAPLGDLFDAVCVFVVQVAADRLKNSGDLRNAEVYAARHERGFCKGETE